MIILSLHGNHMIRIMKIYTINHFQLMINVVYK